MIVIFLSYLLVLISLKKFNLLEKYNISLALGFIIMWRTKRGREFLDKLSRARTFWKWYGNIAIAITLFFMVIIFITMLLGAIVAVTIPTEIMPFENILVLPGLNPIIPLWYGIIALAIAIILHEFTHGILARRVKLKIKSLGLLFVVIPIGAFVEPDEEGIEKLNRADRARIFAGGPTTNIFFSFIFAAIFCWVFMASLAPVEDGVLILNVSEDFPAEDAGIKPGMVLTGVEYIGTNEEEIETIRINERKDFVDFMDEREVNDTINIIAYYKGETHKFENITLVDQYNNTELEDDRGKGFLGVFGIGAGEFRDGLAYPVQSADSREEARDNVLQLVFVFPMDLDSKILPFHSPITDAYEITGPISVLPEPLFWVLANVFFYLFWINILLGIFNTLPAIPLDGGYVLRDCLGGLMARIKPKMDEKKRETYVNSFSLSLAFLILILLLMVIIGPRILFGT